MRNPPRMYFRTYDPLKNSAHEYYRIDVPARELLKLGVDVTRDTEVTCRTADDMQAHLTAAAMHDFYHCFSTGGKVMESIQRMFRRLKEVRDLDGSVHAPPNWISDINDNLDYVHPINPAFARVGTRLPDGTPLYKLLKEPREEQRIDIRLDGADGAAGEMVTIWKNGEKGFDIKRNWRGICSLNRIFQRSAGVSFTTERLREYYVTQYKLENTFVLPDSVVFEDYPPIRLHREPGKLRVMWQGGDNHFPDFYPMAGTFREAARRFPEITWVIWGAYYPWIEKAIPKERIERHEWVPYDAFKIKLAALDYDIAIAPLVDNIFNWGKSAIKFYETSALPFPKPILAARVPPYKDVIRDGETGMMFDMPSGSAEEVSEEFLTKLEALLRDGTLREQLAQNARAWCAENVAASITVPKWWNWLEETRAGLQNSK